MKMDPCRGPSAELLLELSQAIVGEVQVDLVTSLPDHR